MHKTPPEGGGVLCFDGCSVCSREHPTVGGDHDDDHPDVGE